MSVLSRPDFASLSGYCDGSGAKLYLAVKHRNGSIETYGKHEDAIMIFKGAASGKKRVSGDWIPRIKPCAPTKPLSEYYMNTKGVINEFRRVLKGFIGKEKIGMSENGQCLWDTKIDVNELDQSKKTLRRCGYKACDISLSNVIEWRNLKNEYLKSSPPKVINHDDGSVEKVFKLSCRYVNFCVF